ncbi:MAG: FtsX-like permease family protein, partial [Nakamurella sp.]
MNRLRVLLLLAWRDVLRHKGRSLLIVTLVALPVLVIGAADVLYRSTQETPLEQVDGELGASSAYLSAPAGATRVEQNPTENSPARFTTGRTVKDPSGDYPESVDVSTTPLKPAGQVLPLLPAGSVITPWEHGQVPISTDGAHYRMVTADLLDLASPAAAGRYRLVGGAPATGNNQVIVTTTLANQIGATIGSTVSLGSPATVRSVVGLMEPTSRASNTLAVVGRPGSIPGAIDYNGPHYLVTGPQPITWNIVQQLNSHGIQAYSRAVVLDPPYVQGYDQQRFDSTAASAMLAGIVLVVLGLTQVVFLSGPAFAIGARRMRRQLGLASSVGAAPRQIAGVVLSTGLVLGLIGALLGAALGAIVGAVVQPLVTSWTHIQFAAVHIRIGELAVVAAVGVVTSVLAATWPAVTALRTDPISALSRRTRPPKKPGLISLVGLLLAVVGVLIVVVAASRSVPTGEQVDLAAITQRRAIWIATGVLATQLGLIVGAPQIVAVLGRLGSVVPTTPRLALRSTARHRGRSTGAIATILVATTGAVLGAVLISTNNAQNAADYRPNLA